MFGVITFRTVGYLVAVAAGLFLGSTYGRSQQLTECQGWQSSLVRERDELLNQRSKLQSDLRDARRISESNAEFLHAAELRLAKVRDAMEGVTLSGEYQAGPAEPVTVLPTSDGVSLPRFYRPTVAADAYLRSQGFETR